jgi:hypothetical protein
VTASAPARATPRAVFLSSIMCGRRRSANHCLIEINVQGDRVDLLRSAPGDAVATESTRRAGSYAVLT